MFWKSLFLAVLPVAALSAQTLVPVPDEPDVPELAGLMGELQRLTHKLVLSADAGNLPLVEMYTHESLEQLKKIQTETPEYEGQPVAVLIDRFALPSYEKIKAAVAGGTTDKTTLLDAAKVVVESCNTCHAATQRAFIRITAGTEHNPFNQIFTP